MKKVRLIISILLVTVTLTLLIVFLTTNNKMVEYAFDISTTITLTLSVTLSLTLNIKDSFNTTNYYNKNEEDLDRAWKTCYQIYAKVSLMIGLLQFNGVYNGDREGNLNKYLKEITQLSDEGKNYICVYDDLQNVTVVNKPKIDFINEYLNTIDILNKYLPIRLLNTSFSEEKNKELHSLLLLLKDKYEFFKKKQEEKYI